MLVEYRDNAVSCLCVSDIGRLLELPGEGFEVSPVVCLPLNV
jgi:hypothetical protein